MRRWNGWGDTRISYPLPPKAASFIAAAVGEGRPTPDAEYETVLQSVPDSRMEIDNWPASTGLITTDPANRLAHACGQSLPDWLALRSGQISCYPDGVAYPETGEQVRALLRSANEREILVIPYGGGTSVVGHIDPLPGDRPGLTVDLRRLSKLVGIDETNRLATVEAGISGPALENELKQRGYTFGHFPQSFEQSTVGGWIATRSTGQQSFYYGRIEELFAGGHLETPADSLEFPAFSASAAGPDLRQIFLGSEGRLGIMTTATLRIRPQPAYEAFFGLFFPDWARGMAALREIALEKTSVSMLRLSDADETMTTLILSGKEGLVDLAEHGLNLLGYDRERCLLVLGLTGDWKSANYARRRAFEIVRGHGGLLTRLYTTAGAMIGRTWRKSRFLTPYLRNTLWERGYALDTLETVLPWSKILDAAQEIKSCIRTGLEPVGEKVLVFAHLSHVYRDGASLYITFLFRRMADPQSTLQHWQRLKVGASQVIVNYGGTISHQHGVGIDHAGYLPAEKGPAGMAMLTAMLASLDPRSIMNPGKLIMDDVRTSEKSRL